MLGLIFGGGEGGGGGGRGGLYAGGLFSRSQGPVWCDLHWTSLNWKADSLVFSKSRLRLFAEVSLSRTTNNKDVSSENNLHLLLISFDKSLMYMKNNKSPKMNPCSTPARRST